MSNIGRKSPPSPGNIEFVHPSQPGDSGPHLSRESSPSNIDKASYQDQISNINPQVDLRTVNKHLVSPEETLKMQGGDIARHMHQQLENVNSREQDHFKKRTRSSSFSTFLGNSRRESTASDINVPGGFRREFLINKSFQERAEPPNFLTRNFVEFLSIYGHFAGEDFEDDETENDEAVIDEESLLLPSELRLPPPRRRILQRKGTASLPKTFFLVFKALVGSGILFLPRAFRNGGLVFSALGLMCFGALTFMCYVILIRSKRIFNKSSFGELGFKTYGKPLKICILVSIVISQIGFVGTYILFSAENISSFMEFYLELNPNFLSTADIVLIQCILLIPFVLIRDLTKLSLISLISSAFIVVGLIIIFYYSGIRLLAHGISSDIVNFNSNSWPMLIGVAVTSFEGIGLILPIEAAMAQPEKFTFVLSFSMVIITTLFVLIGIVGYTSYGEHVKSIIILNLPQDKLSVQLISLLYSLAVFLTAPLQIFPVTKILESLVFNSLLFRDPRSNRKDEDGRLYHNSGKYSKSVKWLKNLVRATLISLVCLLAYLNADNIDKFISFNGCFACIPLVYIYPPLIHLKTYKLDQQKTVGGSFLKVFDFLLIAVGIVAVIYTTYQILFQI